MSQPSGPVDIVLSSGFLAFGAQAGFLAGVEDAGVEVAALCGTSSGALAASLWAAGMPAERILERLAALAPLRQVRPSGRPWRGLFSLKPVIRTLSRDLPARFEDLERPLGVGVMDLSGRPVLLTSGALPEAVAASCAIPRLFAPVAVDGVRWADGGLADRTALRAWRAMRPSTPVVLHLVDRSKDGQDPADLTGCVVVRSPRADARLWDLGDTAAAYRRTREVARSTLAAR